MAHRHSYDEQGRQLCCLEEAGLDYGLAGPATFGSGHVHTEGDGHDHAHSHEDGHDHAHETEGVYQNLPILISLVILIAGILFDHYLHPSWFQANTRLIWYIAAYALVGIPVMIGAVEGIKKGDIFSEFTLMVIATLGAFAIGEYPEGVAVMLFYSIGEYFQSMAVRRAKTNISALISQRPDEAHVVRNGNVVIIKAEQVAIGELIQLRPGEKLSLDGILESESASFNTAALTGESVPDRLTKGEKALAGMINLDSTALVRVTTAYDDTKLSQILEMVQSATKHKAPTELFIRKFARIYTPIVVALAAAICIVPYFFVADYHLSDWLYRALVFLVISCPCALVISIPLGYFGGIGAASKQGILIKGSNFLDVLAGVDHVVMDKTGTLTEGVFKVSEVKIESGFDPDMILAMVNALESHSTHPVATAIHDYVGKPDATVLLEAVREYPGEGMYATVGDKVILAGNFRLMDRFSIAYNLDPATITETVIAIAYDGQFAGYLTIADVIKQEAVAAIQDLKRQNIRTTMLSGDKITVVKKVAEVLGIQEAFGGLLPEDKVNIVKKIASEGARVAFVGDGLNDAPVVAVSDVGIAMAGLGSDATIETADVVIQDDNINKVPLAITIGKKTKAIVWQNISLAFIVKLAVLILGAGGLATMWEAVFADVGVALLAILNAVRIQHFTQVKL